MISRLIASFTPPPPGRNLPLTLDRQVHAMDGVRIVGNSTNVRSPASSRSVLTHPSRTDPALDRLRTDRPQSEIAVTSLYAVAIFIVKAAILFLYIRIFDSSRTVKYTAWALFLFMFGHAIASFFLSIFPCRPVRAYWTSEPSTCINTFVLGYISAVISIVTDIAIFVLPLPQIWRMRLPLRVRLQVIAVLATGLLYVCHRPPSLLIPPVVVVVVVVGSSLIPPGCGQDVRGHRHPDHLICRSVQAIRYHLAHL